MTPTATLPAPLQSISSTHLFALELNITAVQRIGTDTIVGVVGGGSFEGSRLRGRVLEGGSDWQRVMPDGTVLLDCRIVLETAPGELIAMTYQGVRSGPPDVLARLAQGADVRADDYYLRIAPLFRAQSSAHAWLNKLVAVGTGMRLPKGPIYNVFEVL
ncbi:MAG TPA: DUF3237 domain-containing protein [Steroidobacter sp.]